MSDIPVTAVAAPAPQEATDAKGPLPPSIAGPSILRTGTPTAPSPKPDGAVVLTPETVEAIADEAERLRAVELLRETEREQETERPCIFKSISPAWSNANLTRLAEKIRSPLVFAHVRASTMAGARELACYLSSN